MINLAMEKLGPHDSEPGTIEFGALLPWISETIGTLGWIADPFAQDDAVSKLCAFTLGCAHALTKN